MTDKPSEHDILGMLRKSESDLAFKLELVRKQIREWEELHARATGSAVSAGEFSLLKPQDAVMQYMKRAKRATRQQIVESLLIARFKKIDKVKDPKKSVNTAITILVNHEDLEEPGRTPDDKRTDENSEIILVK